jgi:hypothetical protein
MTIVAVFSSYAKIDANATAITAATIVTSINVKAAWRRVEVRTTDSVMFIFRTLRLSFKKIP